MPSQSSIRHESIALSVASAATTLSANTRDVMLAKLVPYLKDGETMPDAGLFQELLGRFLADRAGDLGSADQAYSTAIRRHRALRIELLAAMAEVRSELRAVRDVSLAVGRNAPWSGAKPVPAVPALLLLLGDQCRGFDASGHSSGARSRRYRTIFPRNLLL